MTYEARGFFWPCEVRIVLRNIQRAQSHNYFVEGKVAPNFMICFIYIYKIPAINISAQFIYLTIQKHIRPRWFKSMSSFLARGGQRGYSGWIGLLMSSLLDKKLDVICYLKVSYWVKTAASHDRGTVRQLCTLHEVHAPMHRLHKGVLELLCILQGEVFSDHVQKFVTGSFNSLIWPHLTYPPLTFMLRANSHKSGMYAE